jgi:hypothetical protein
MRKIKSTLLAIVFLFATLTQTGCIGSFGLTNNLYEWNKGLGGKVAQEAVFLVFVIIPVYGVTLLIDAVILNSIEFWSGNNPMSMNADDKEVQIVNVDGLNFEITATQNKFQVVQLDGDKAGQSYDLVYQPEELSWYLQANGKSVKVSKFDPKFNNVDLLKPNGDVIKVDASVNSRNAVKAAVNLEMAQI